jgi:hypothetical protein
MDALGQVLSGWTGSLVIAGAYTVTPRQRESVVSFMARVIPEVYVASLAATGTALTLSLTISTAGVMTLSGSAVFTLSATGTTQTRTVWTGTYTGASTYTAAGAFTGAYVPEEGLALDLAAPWQSQGSAAADGLLAWSGPEQVTRATLSLWTGYADAWDAELLAGEWDVWAGSRMLGRVFVERFRRVPVSRLLRSGMMEVRGEGVSVYVEEGIPMEIPQAWPTAMGWLYSWVDTSVVGYREVDLDALGSVTIGSDYQRWDEFVADLITAVDTAASGSGALTYQPDGRLFFDSVADVAEVVTWTDRLGWLCGFGVEAGATDEEWFNAGVSRSRFVPPGGIPLLSCSWSEVDVDTDGDAILDRHRKRQGYVYGAARLWSVRATMTRWALQALMTGWCLRGKLTAVALSELNAIDPAEPGGAITGYVLGLDRVTWLDPAHQRTAVVEFTLSTEGA